MLWVEALTHSKAALMGSCISSGKKPKPATKNKTLSSGLTEPLVENEEAAGSSPINVQNPLSTPTREIMGGMNRALGNTSAPDTSHVEALLSVASSPDRELNIRKDVFPNGDWYEGEHTLVALKGKKGAKGKKAVKHGKGKYVYHNGSIFHGYYFEDEMLEGQFFHAGHRSTYAGRFKDCHYHGHGRIVYHSDEVETSLADSETTHEATSTNSEQSTAVREVEYEGQFKFGLRGGHGKLKLSDGRWIEGLFKHDRLLAMCPDEVDEDGLSWTAKVALAFGEVYIGPLNDRYQFHTPRLEDSMASKTNESRLELRSGDVVKAYFANGNLVPPARVERSNGEAWVGDVDEDFQICGQGKLSYKSGDVYIGAVLPGGVRNGDGTQIAVNGSTYRGSWMNNEFHGEGTMRFVDGATYTGDWFKGERHGTGIMTYYSGNVYEGQWAHDKKQGSGKAIFLNGDVFKGCYVNDRRDGEGTTTHTDGRPADRALYEDGELVQMKGSAGKLTNSLKFAGRMLGVRKHGEPLLGGGGSSKSKSTDS